MRKIFTLAAISFLGFSAQAQNLAPDQNPNYKTSQDKYMKVKDSLLTESNTTIQNTYKAYDWYEARQERRQLRRDRRYNYRMAALNYGYNDWDYGYQNRYYRGYYSRPFNNRFYGRPGLGYRTGNWMFFF